MAEVHVSLAVSLITNDGVRARRQVLPAAKETGRTDTARSGLQLAMIPMR